MPLLKKFVLLAVFITLSACAGPLVEPETVYQVVKVYVTASPGPTLTPSRTPTPTPTPTQTPTPTPTAPPVSVTGDPWIGRRVDPVPQSGAPCGLVDLLDFPLKPPDGEGAHGGDDFGVYRGTYLKYHAGEDWGLAAGSNFGEPVYSVGHGQVTYAAPNGWGEDGGVVIIRHIIPGERSVLSFYGHLDPPSVVLHAGDCVARGEKVGEIGRPRTPPHLHFEIRTHMPILPGPGYWSVDPTLAGWLPPSRTIWNNRLSTAPGVLWTRGDVGEFSRGLGSWDSETFVAVKNWRLVGLGVEDGAVHWSTPISVKAATLLMDADNGLVYVSSRLGELSTFDISQMQEGDITTDPEATPEPAWGTNLEAYGEVVLMPLPGGGVVVAGRQGIHALSTLGERLWRINLDAPVVSWVRVGDELLFTTGGGEPGVWSVRDGDPEAWETPLSGKLAAGEDQVYLYQERGIYRLDLEVREVERLYALPKGFNRLGDILPLPGGGLLVAHLDYDDRRLIALSQGGSPLWERSLADLPEGGGMRLLAVGTNVYLMMGTALASASKISLLRVDLETGDLTRFFEGGSRDPVPEDTWIQEVSEGRLLFNIGGGSMLLLDPNLAMEVVTGGGYSP
jgi:murein DD-endopeptidase MepM/ murein hydrolase activator NlpD